MASETMAISMERAVRRSSNAQAQSSRRFGRSLIAALLLACTSSPTPPGEDAAAPASDASSLVGATWALSEIQSMDDRVFIPHAPDRFTLRLLEDGTVEVVAHCNRGRGTWSSESPGQLRFGPIAMTRAYCGDDSLDTRFLRELSHVRSYVLQEQRLYLATFADGAILMMRRLDDPARSEGPSFDHGRAETSSVPQRFHQLRS